MVCPFCFGMTVSMNTFSIQSEVKNMKRKAGIANVIAAIPRVVPR